MPAPLAGILARIGAGLFGRAAVGQAGTRAAGGVASAGASLAERATVLKKTDQLLSQARVAGITGVGEGRVGLRQQVELSERVADEDAQQKARAEQAATKNAGQLGTALKAMTLGMVGAVIGLKKLGDAVDGITSSILERQRELAPLSGQIASAFARLELRTRVIQVERAGAIGGSTAVLADAIGDLRETLEPLRQTFATAVNVSATVAAKVTQGIAILVQWQPVIQLLGRAAGLYENLAGSQAGAPFVGNLQAMLRGGFAANGGVPLGREQDVAVGERRDAEIRAGIAREGQRDDHAEQERKKAQDRRRRQAIADDDPGRLEPPRAFLR